MRCPSCDSEDVHTTVCVNMSTGQITDYIALCFQCSNEWRPGRDEDHTPGSFAAPVSEEADG